MPQYDDRIHRAHVVTSDSATGRITVKLPGKFGNQEVLDISFTGREIHAANSKWLVPAAGDNIIVCQEDEDCTDGVFWINTTVPPDPPYTFDDSLNTRFGTGDDAVLQVDRTSGQIRVNTPTAETEPSGGLYYPLVVKANNSTWPSIKITPGSTVNTTRASIMLHKTIMGAGSTAGHEGDWYVYDNDNSKYNLLHTGHSNTTTGGLTIRSTGLSERYIQLQPAYVTGGNEWSTFFINNALGATLFNTQPYTYTHHPYADNTYDLGSGYRWQDIHLVNQPTVTSDQNEKTDIADSDLGLDFVNALRPVSFKWRDRGGGVAGVRTHYGLLGQEVEAVLGAAASDTAIWIKKAIEAEPEVPADEYLPGKPAVEAHDRQGLRYDELIAPIIKAVQELTTRLTALESA